MTAAFNDHFAPVAGNYAQFRPTYPPELFDWLAHIAPGRALAWDCAAGNGQASVDLAQRFQAVRATDASAAQIAGAVPHDGIAYAVAPAEQSGLDDCSADLVTVAQALHWFDLDAFYAEVKRVLKPDGVLAVWSYGVQSVAGAEVDALIQAFYRDTVGPFWPPQRAHVENGYRTLAFPFAEIAVPAVAMTAQWTLAQLLGYLGSWSATARYIAHHGSDPVAPLGRALAAVWGDPQDARCVTWPLAIRAGRVD